MGAKKWSRNKLFRHSQKQKVIVGYLNTFRIEGHDGPIVFYGTGEFSSGRKGAVYVTCKWLKRARQEMYECVAVDKFWKHKCARSVSSVWQNCASLEKYFRLLSSTYP